MTKSKVVQFKYQHHKQPKLIVKVKHTLRQEETNFDILVGQVESKYCNRKENRLRKCGRSV